MTVDAANLDQLPLTWSAPVREIRRIVFGKHLTHAERAQRFHDHNPQVYTMAVDVARYMKARGVKRYGIGAVWEILRFKYLETTGDVFKLNNNYRAFYARLIASREPDLADFFEMRRAG